jgi:hypothetical protein
LELLADQFGMPSTVMDGAGDEKVVPASSVEMSRLVSLLLGKSINVNDVTSKEIYGKFFLALTTIFDAINEIISVINITLLGQSPELETIRKVIGSNIENGVEKVSLKEYLDRIKEAFLVAHKSFQASATTIISEILSELDPKSIASERISGLKFGPLRKAELYGLYEEKFIRCNNWFNSEKYIERLLREFEKNCQQSFNSSTR